LPNIPDIKLTMLKCTSGLSQLRPLFDGVILRNINSSYLSKEKIFIIKVWLKSKIKDLGKLNKNEA
jgi:hypothetical protein